MFTTQLEEGGAIRQAKGSTDRRPENHLRASAVETMTSEHPFGEASVTRCTRKDSIWLQYSGGVVYIFEQNPKI